MNRLAVLQMIQVSDSLFPIGAFTLSNGLETFVSNGRLKTDEDLKKYLDSYISILPYNDLGVMMLAYKHSSDKDYIKQLDALSMAIKAPMEVRIGCKKLCSRFLKLWNKMKNYEMLEEYRRMIGEGKCQGNHAIAVGIYAFEIGLECEESASIYSYSLLSAIITNAVKTVPLSQIQGQKILNMELEKIEKCVRIASSLTMDDLGVGGSEFDIAAMNHECLYSRLYMS